MAVYIERTSDERVRPLKSRQPPEGQQKRNGPMRQVDGSTEKPHGRWFDGTSRLFFFFEKKKLNQNNEPTCRESWAHLMLLRLSI